jgi:hypothetical protein
MNVFGNTGIPYNDKTDGHIITEILFEMAFSKPVII